MVKRLGNFFIKNFEESSYYIKESKSFIYLIISIFVFFVLIGIFIPTPTFIEQRILGIIEDLIKKTQDMSMFELINFIFFNNLQTSFLGLFFGFFLGIFPLVIGIANGYILGFVISKSVQAEGFFVLWRLLPHGIFELPAIFISLGIGLKLGLWLIIEPIKFYWNKNKLVILLFILFYLPTLIITLWYHKKFRKIMLINFYKFRENILKSAIVFVFFVIPLLLFAAIIEGGLIFLFG
ncbi:MAG: stage II sporulation protein M [Candidatus Pacearchaeota archaeon]